jgi:hypothetical protein
VLVHPKVVAAATGSTLGGSVSVIVVWLIRLHGIDVPHEVAGAITVLAGATIAALAGYFTPTPPAKGL